MGRGRAKAKQTKVARALKYGSVDSDFGALQAELSQHHPSGLEGSRDLAGTTSDASDDSDDEDDSDDDPYARYYDGDDVDDVDEVDQTARRA